MASLEPGIGELNAHQSQLILGKSGQPALNTDVRVAEQVMQVVAFEPIAVALCRQHQGTADLHAEMIPVGFQGR